MELEIFTMESIEAGQVVNREDEMNIISSTWAFCKVGVGIFSKKQRSQSWHPQFLKVSKVSTEN
jgi:hypothetical protein